MTAEPHVSRTAAIATVVASLVLIVAIWAAGWRELSAALRATGRPVEQRLQAALPCRAQAGRLWNGIRWHLTGSTPATVVRGRNGWWFYASEHAGDGHSLDELEGRVPEAPEEGGWAAAVQARAAAAQARGGVYLAIVPPDKHSVRSDELPVSLHRATATTRLQRLVTALGPDPPLLDLRPAVTDGFPRSDSHWIDDGAFAAYEAIHRRLALRGPLLGRGSFVHLPYQWPGDIWALRQAGPRSEPVELWQAAAVLPARWLDGEAVARPGLFHLPAAQAGWRMTAGGWREAITTVDDPSLPTAVIFHDSFMPALLPYLAQHFRRARFVWCHYLAPVVAEERPDVVIHENVARNVQWLGKVSDVP